MTDLDKLHAEGMALLEDDRDWKALETWLRANARALLEGIAAMRRKVVMSDDQVVNAVVESLMAEREAMRRERDAFETLCTHHLNKRDALQRDLDAAPADARRYRWLRQGALTERTENSRPIVMQRWHTGSLTYTYGEVLDAAIDSAMQPQETTKC